MARCEDWPCCGHEAGCCPDYDASGRQLNMKCICGATVPLSSRSSLCPACLNAPDSDPDGYPIMEYEDDWDEDDDNSELEDDDEEDMDEDWGEDSWVDEEE